MTTLAEVAARPGRRRAATARSPRARAAAASPQLRNQGTLGGNLCQRPRCWYYRGDFHCARKGGEKCFAVEGENQFHCIFGGDVCFIVHPSDTAPALVALDAIVRVTGTEREPLGAGRDVLRPSREPTTRARRARPRRDRHRDRPAAAAGRDPRHATARCARAASWDFALAGAAVVATVAGGRVERARIVLSGRGAGRPGACPEAERAVIGQRLNAAGRPQTRRQPPSRAPSRSPRTATRSSCCAARSRRRCSRLA